MNWKTIALIGLYTIGMLGFALMYLLEKENSSLYHSILFAIVVCINRLSVEFHTHKEKVMKFIYISELCFAIYMFFIFFYGDQYFTLYKLLIVPSVVLSILQIFLLKRLKLIEE